MNRKKTIIAAVVLMLVLLVGGLIAYFTDTDQKKNTFTIGNVDITLNEVWNATDGQGVVPGQKIDKKPTVENTGDSKAYVFLKVTIPCHNSKALFTLEEVNAAWNQVETTSCDAAEGNATVIYSYGSLTELAKDAETPELFKQVKLDSSLTKTDAEALKDKNLDVVVDAYGIQVDGLEVSTPAEVYALFSSGN